MGEFDLNLSTRPFPAYQLKLMLLTAALASLIALSVWQAYGFMRYSGLAKQIRGGEQSARIDAEALGRRLDDLDEKLNRPEATQKMAEIQFLNNILTKKALSWTRIFSDLEELMPEGVHLVSLRPDFTVNEPAVLHIEVMAHSINDWKKLAESLQSVPAFDELIVSTEDKKQINSDARNTSATDVSIAFTVQYHPEKEGQ